MAAIGPPIAEYGADEISALVLDPGYSVVRAGFAGEDTPKSVIPSFYGYSASKTSYLFDDNAIYNPLADVEIRNPMASDGTVENWDVAAKLWEYAVTSRLTGPQQTKSIRHDENDRPTNGGIDVEMEDVENAEKPLAESPLLMTEPGWNSAKNREKAIELAMEDWGCPAFYLGRSGVLAAFASGKPSALVIDVGASTMSITPVHDGLILRKGTQKSPLAGNFISDQIRLLFSQSQPPIPMTPHYLVSSKSPVDAGTPPQATYKTFARPPHESFRRLQEERVLTEFKESCVQIWNPARYNSSGLQTSTEWLRAQQEPGRPFEMPDGWNNVFGVDRYRVTEGMFDEKAALTDSSAPTLIRAQTLPGLVSASVSATDVDIRAHLLANVVITGGTSLLQGMTDRVNFELQTMFPGPRVRLQAPGNVVERKYAGWIGGSILASLGAFNQMWISKKEYDEFGGEQILARRCK